jgi:hypothetical protein
MELVTVLQDIKVNTVNKKVASTIAQVMDFARIILVFAKKTILELIAHLNVVNGIVTIEDSAI